MDCTNAFVQATLDKDVFVSKMSHQFLCYRQGIEIMKMKSALQIADILPRDCHRRLSKSLGSYWLDFRSWIYIYTYIYIYILRFD